MKTYTVSVLRTSRSWCDIEISAASEAEARATVLDICDSKHYDSGKPGDEYSIEEVSAEGETA